MGRPSLPPGIYFVHVSAFNLGLWLRTLFGIGTPRSLQGRVVALGAMIAALWTSSTTR